MRHYLKWFLIAFLVLAPTASAAKITWKPDKNFAKVVKVAWEQANKGYQVSEDVCVQPDLPRATALTAGVASDDCLVVAHKGSKPVCFELVYEAGNTTGQAYSCKLVLLSIKRDTKPGWAVKYKTKRAFIA